MDRMKMSEYFDSIDRAIWSLSKRYRFVTMDDGQSIDDYDRTAYPSAFVLCPILGKSKRDTRFDLWYVNTAKRGQEPVVRRGIKPILDKATLRQTCMLLEAFVILKEIEEAEDLTFRRGRRKDPADGKETSKYFTTRRVNVTVHQLCRLLEAIEIALDEENIKGAKKIMTQWEDHILGGHWKEKNERKKARDQARDKEAH